MVTVLFIDAVSSTAVGERMDPESLRAVLTRYFDVMGAAIDAHGGVVEKFIGDAVMAVFGVPAVHEDDALRACRAAVEINRRLAELEPEIRADLGVAIEWRMGINTGPVLAGDMAGRPEDRDRRRGERGSSPGGRRLAWRNPDGRRDICPGARRGQRSHSHR